MKKKGKGKGRGKKARVVHPADPDRGTYRPGPGKPARRPDQDPPKKKKRKKK